jgi:hypothetical protein
MDRMHPAVVTELPQLEAIRVIPLTFRRAIVAMFAVRASQRYYDTILFAFASHFFLRLRSGSGLPSIQ